MINKAWMIHPSYWKINKKWTILKIKKILININFIEQFQIIS
jgi:hypothetical protein